MSPPSAHLADGGGRNAGRAEPSEPSGGSPPGCFRSSFRLKFLWGLCLKAEPLIHVLSLYIRGVTRVRARQRSGGRGGAHSHAPEPEPAQNAEGFGAHRSDWGQTEHAPGPGLMVKNRHVSAREGKRLAYSSRSDAASASADSARARAQQLPPKPGGRYSGEV